MHRLRQLAIVDRLLDDRTPTKFGIQPPVRSADYLRNTGTGIPRKWQRVSHQIVVDTLRGLWLTPKQSQVWKECKLLEKALWISYVSVYATYINYKTNLPCVYGIMYYFHHRSSLSSLSSESDSLPPQCSLG